MIKSPLIKSLYLVLIHTSSLSLVWAIPNTSPNKTRGIIDQVTLFADRAEVTRVLPFKCAKSAKGVRVTFDDLPPTLDQRTLRGVVSGQAQVIGVSKNTRPLMGGEEVGDRARLLRDQENNISLKERVINDAQQLVQEEMKQLDQRASVLSGSINRGLSTSKINVKRWSRALDYLKLNRTKLLNRQLEHQRELKKLQLERERLNRTRQKIKTRPKDHTLFAIISLKCLRAEVGKVKLSYVIPSATWKPEYDLRLTSKSKKKVGSGRVEMNIGAIIRQSTGEDWKNVQVFLSTAEPKLGASAPQIASLQIRGQEKKTQKVLVQAQEDRKQLNTGRTAHTKTSTDTSTPFEDRGQSFILKLPHRMTILADGHQYWSPVHTFKTKADLSLMTIPKLSPHVFQMVHFSNPAPHPLLSGVAHIYRSGTYIGDASFEYKGEGEKIEVSLGIESSLKVVRTSLLNKNQEASLFSSDRTLIRSYQVEVLNQSRQSLVVDVRENLPVSKVKDLQVELDKEKTTKGYKLDKYRGFLDWSLKLKSGKSKRVNFSYRVKIPESWKIR